MGATNMRLPVDDQHGEQTPEAGSQRILITHAVLVGCSLLVPIPVLDDLAKSYFRKQLVRSLAAVEGRSLSDGELDALAVERRSMQGFLLSALIYPLKVTLSTVFYFMKFKRAAHLAARTYQFGYLVAYAIRSREGGGGLLDLHGAVEVNEAIQDVIRDGNIKPLESALGATFRQSKRALRAGGALLAGNMRRLTGLAPPEQVAEVIGRIESDEEREIEPVVVCLQRSIGTMPEEYFRALRAQLETRLGSPSHVVSSGTGQASQI